MAGHTDCTKRENTRTHTHTKAHTSTATALTLHLLLQLSDSEFVTIRTTGCHTGHSSVGRPRWTIKRESLHATVYKEVSL